MDLVEKAKHSQWCKQRKYLSGDGKRDYDTTEALIAEVERLQNREQELIGHTYDMAEEREMLREALEKAKSTFVDLELYFKLIHKDTMVAVVQIAFKGSEEALAEPERWGCCGAKRQEIHGQYCPRCS